MPAERASLAASLLRQRSLCIALCGAGGAHVVATALGLPGWECPFRAATGIPCPGCGLTRASLRLLRGDFAGAMHEHPFAPVAVAAIALVVLGAVSPRALRERLLLGLERVDRRSRLSAAVLGLLMIFWIGRLALDSRG